MHHFIFPSKDTWISSGSNKVTGEKFTNQNFGRDQILEIKKQFFNFSFDFPTRALVEFSGTEFTELSASIVDRTIPSSSAEYYLRMYEAEGNSEFSDTPYILAAQPLSQSWTEGVGKFGDNPKNIHGCSWNNYSSPLGLGENPWDTTGGDVLSVSSSAQTFSSETADIEMDVTNMTNMWLKEQVPNNGMLIRFSGAQETDSIRQANLKFFSRNTHTIFSPRLEVRWDDHLPCTGSNTGSLTELTMSGLADNFLYMQGLREEYKVGERVKFRVGARKRYIQKSFTTSVQTVTGSYIPEGSGSYAIKDVATDEFIVPFSAYTSMSCDANGPYFNQWLDGFYPDRVYKIQLKLKYDDGQEQVFDDDFEFIVKRK
tara:strand:- start:1709 stop:2821 length:1113 start_codon:yes stop_codon:yes gene_type:complete